MPIRSLAKMLPAIKVAAWTPAASLVVFTTVDGRAGAAVALWAESGWDLLVAIESDRRLKTFRTPIAPENDLGNLEQNVGAVLPRYTNLPQEDAYGEAFATHMQQGNSQALAVAATAEPTMKALAVKSTAATFGTALGSYNAVTAYRAGLSNAGNETGSAYGYNSVSGYKTGLKWHCVEFSNRYFWLKFGRKIAGGNANSFYGSAGSKGLNRAPHGGTNGPQLGRGPLCAGGPCSKGGSSTDMPSTNQTRRRHHGSIGLRRASRSPS